MMVSKFGERIQSACLSLVGKDRYTAAAKRLEAWSDHYSKMRLGHYKGGDTGRLQGDWATTYDTPYGNLKNNRTNLIARSITLIDNNPIVKGLVETIISDVVNTGLKPTPRVKFDNGDLVIGINKQLANDWERYNDQWDSTGKESFYEIQKMVLRETIISGGVLTNRIKDDRAESHLNVANQVVSVLRLDTSKDAGAPTYSDNQAVSQTVHGINVDSSGLPISYWIKGINNPVSAKNMHQIFVRNMAEMYTGVPWLAPSLRWLWAQEELIKDKLIASRIQAMIGIIFPDNMMGTLLGNDTNSSNQLQFESGKVYHYNPQSGGKPEILQADDSVQTVLQPLMRILLHAITVSLGWSYQTVTRDVNDVSFASAKVNTNKDRQFASMGQKWLSKDYCQKEWEYFVFREFLENKIPGKSLIDYYDDPWRWSQCQWRAPGWDFIDPAREAQAVQILRENKLMTLQDWYGQRGIDWRDAVDQLAVEDQYLKENKVEVKSEPVQQGTNDNSREYR